MKNLRNARAMLCTCSLVAVVPATPAIAQDTIGPRDGRSGDEASEVPDIVVTGTKMGAASLQKTPLAITALSAEAIDRSVSSDIRDLVSIAPSLTVSENTGFAQIYIRGVGSNNVFAGSEASTTTQIDGVYLGRPSNAFSEFLDIERVEILRGPQGTLYGRNSVGGTINIITGTPSNATRTKFRTLFGNYDQVKVEGAISGPIVTDVLQASLSGVFASHDDYIRNIFPGNRGLNNENSRAVRGKLRFLPASPVEIVLAGDYSLQKGRPWGSFKIIHPKPGFMFQQISDLHTVSQDGEGFGRNKQYGVSATITADLTSQLKLTSITAYRNSRYSLGADTDATELHIRYTTIDERQNQFSQEVEFNLNTDPVKAVAGFYYFQENVDLDFAINLFGIARASTFRPRVQTRAYAGFAQADLALGDRLTLTAGGRYSRETKDISQSGGLFSLIGSPVQGAFAFSDRNEFAAFTPKVGINFRPTDTSLLYASITRGFKSGGFNISSTVAGRGFAPEYVWAYEVGAKTDLFDRKLRLNGSAFYYDYTDLQVQTFVAAGVIDITNAASATIKGIELEATVSPARGIQFGGNVTYLDAAYKQYIAAVNGTPFDAAGNALNLAPKWKFSAFGGYSTDIGREGQLFTDAQVSFQDTVFFSPDNNIILRQSAYALVNARIGYRRDGGRWTISAFVKNATDHDYLTAADSIAPPGFAGRTGDPRTYGVQLSVSL